MENLVEIGSTLKQKRLSLNLTMDYVANQANITRATLWSIENGKGNYSINSLLSVMKVLSLNLTVTGNKDLIVSRERASRINTALDKKKNRFIIMCIEQYSSAYEKDSQKTYEKMLKTGVMDELISDYEDLHGMSTDYLNSYINSLLEDK